jgi:7,8-dihydropterin-6-yl-methyl-4-(beta-D-ribofuranosyl)aminobenzene 5'-phosphate synthase
MAIRLLCYTIFIFLVLSFIGHFNRSESVLDIGSVNEVEITVLLDNYPNGTLQNPWGVSFYVETSDHTILFDAGIDPHALGNNSITLGKNISEVDFVVISHEHGDHYLGLEYVAEVNPGIDVYIPNSMLSTVLNDIAAMGFNIQTIADSTVLFPGIALIGQLYGPPYEHAMTINVANVGLVTVVGCSHPGVENLVSKAVNDFGVDPYLVIGGFHLIGSSAYVMDTAVTTMIDLGIDWIYPIHCSGDYMRSFMQTNYPEYYGEGCVGTHLVIDHSLHTEISPMHILIPIIILIPLIPIIKKRQKNI